MKGMSVQETRGEPILIRAPWGQEAANTEVGGLRPGFGYHALPGIPFSAAFDAAAVVLPSLSLSGMSEAAPVLFTNASLLDGSDDTARPGFSVLVEGNVIREVSEQPI